MVETWAGASGDVLRIWLLGRFGVARGPREVATAEWRLRKARSLIKLLALTPRHRLHRERAVEALWPHLESAAAANNLRKVVHVVRRVLASDETGPIGRYLALQDGVLSLGPNGVWVDVDVFEECAERAQRSHEIAAYEPGSGVKTLDPESIGPPEDVFDNGTLRGQRWQPERGPFACLDELS